MFREVLAAAAIAGLIAGFTGDVRACEGQTVLFEEDFSTHDRTWGEVTEQFEMKDGKATAKPPPSQLQWRLNTAFAFDDADICVTVTSVETSNPADTSAGVVFWAKDTNNFYYFAVAPNGFYVVNRRLADKWAVTIPWTKSEAVAVGQGKPNVLRVTTKGQTVTLFVGGAQVARFRAQPPGGSSQIGLLMASGAKPDTWEFAALKVTSPPR